MTIQRVNPNGWIVGDEVTGGPSGQMTQLDINASSGLDKRKGQTDTLSSSVNITGSMTFPNGSSLVISPTAVTIQPGTLKIGAQLQGDSNTNDPLRFGYQSIAATSGTQTLTANQYNTFAIRFTGVLTGNASIIFPSVSGYTKIIDNQTTGNFTLNITTNSATNAGITISSGKQVIMYCDGTNLIQAGLTINNEIISIQSLAESSALTGGTATFGTPISTTSGDTSYHTVVANLNSASGSTYSFSFNNVNTGDIFDIFYRCDGYVTNGSDIMSISVAANGTTLNETIMTSSSTTPAAGVFSSIFTNYTASSTATLTFNLQFKTNNATAGHNAWIAAPLAFSIKQIRP